MSIDIFIDRYMLSSYVSIYLYKYKRRWIHHLNKLVSYSHTSSVLNCHSQLLLVEKWEVFGCHSFLVLLMIYVHFRLEKMMNELLK